MSRGAGFGVVKSSTTRVGFVRKVAQKNGSDATIGSKDVPSQDSAFRAAQLFGTGHTVP